MTDRDLRRIAAHAAAHATLYRDSGRRIETVSIRPGAAHSGITLLAPMSPEMRVLADAATSGRHPLDGLMPEASRFALRHITAVLAGKVAEEIAAPTLGRQPTPPEHPEPTIEELAAEPVRVPSPALLASEDVTEEETHSDDDIAFELAFQLVGLQARPLLTWLTAEALATVVRRWSVIEQVMSTLLVAPHFLDAAAFAAVYHPPKENPQ